MADRPNALELLVRSIHTHQQAAAACIEQSKGRATAVHNLADLGKELEELRAMRDEVLDDPAHGALDAMQRHHVTLTALHDLEAAVHSVGLTLAGAALHLGGELDDRAIDIAVERAGLAPA